MNIGDVILRLVDMVIEEKQKNFELQNQQQTLDEKSNEDYQ